MLPIVRTFISLPAGVARMPFWRFTRPDAARLHPLGARPDAASADPSARTGSDWQDKIHYVDYSVAALIVIGAVYLLIRYRRGRGEEPRATPAPAGRRGRLSR